MITNAPQSIEQQKSQSGAGNRAFRPDSSVQQRLTEVKP
jgi:hypothetical protein